MQNLLKEHERQLAAAQRMRTLNARRIEDRNRIAFAQPAALGREYSKSVRRRCRLPCLSVLYKRGEGLRV